MIDFCINAYNNKQKELIYKAYVTEALRGMCKMNVSYIDLINTQKEPEEERSAEEIKTSIKDGLNNL